MQDLKYSNKKIKKSESEKERQHEYCKAKLFLSSLTLRASTPTTASPFVTRPDSTSTNVNGMGVPRCQEVSNNLFLKIVYSNCKHRIYKKSKLQLQHIYTNKVK